MRVGAVAAGAALLARHPAAAEAADRRFNNSLDGAEAAAMLVADFVRKLEG